MPERPRVLYMAPDVVPFPKGSAGRIGATVKALADLGARVILVTPAGPDPTARLHGVAGVEHRPVPALDPSSNFLDRVLAFRSAALAMLREEPWDIAWFRSPWEGVPAVLEARDRGRLAVYEAHGFPSIELPSHYPALYGHPDLLDKLVDDEGVVLHGAHRVITPSCTGRTWLRSRGVCSGRIDVVPNAVAVGDYLPTAAPDHEPPPLRVLYVGTLAPWQGLSTLLEAVACARGRPDVRLQLVGTMKGPWVRDLKRLAASLRVRDRLDMPGPTDRRQLAALYARAHVCAAPLADDPRNSLQGCCPIKILEYMAAGRPILSTRIRPVEEMLRHGDTAWLARPGSPASLLEGLRWLATRREEAERMGSRARLEAEKAWTPDGFRQRLLEVLRRLGVAPRQAEEEPSRSR